MIRNVEREMKRSRPVHPLEALFFKLPLDNSFEEDKNESKTVVEEEIEEEEKQDEERLKPNCISVLSAYVFATLPRKFFQSTPRRMQIFCEFRNFMKKIESSFMFFFFDPKVRFVVFHGCFSSLHYYIMCVNIFTRVCLNCL